MEDPLVIKKRIAEVHIFPFHPNTSSMRKFIPNKLDADFGPVLGTTLQNMMPYIHSYAEKKPSIV